MSEDLHFEGKKYISSRRAAHEHGYTQDYIGQLIRNKKIDARKIGRSWFVSTDSLSSYHRSSGLFSKPKNLFTSYKPKHISELSDIRDTGNSLSAPQTSICEKPVTPLKYLPDDREPLPALNKKESSVSQGELPARIPKTTHLKAHALLHISQSRVFPKIMSVLGGKFAAGIVTTVILAAVVASNAYFQMDAVRELVKGDREPFALEAYDLASVASLDPRIDEELSALETRELPGGTPFLDSFLSFAGGAIDRIRNAVSDLFEGTTIASMVSGETNPLSRVAARIYKTIDSGFEGAKGMIAGVFGTSGGVADGEQFVAMRDEETDMGNMLALEESAVNSQIEAPAASVSQPIQNIYNVTTGVTLAQVDQRIAESKVLDQSFTLLLQAADRNHRNTRNAREADVTRDIGGSTIVQSIIKDSEIQNSSVQATTLSAVTGDVTNLTFDIASGTSTTATNASFTYATSSFLSVFNAPIAPAFTATSTSATSTFAGGLAIGDTGFVYQQATKRIGIGTTTPDGTISILQSANGTPMISAYRITDTAPTGDFINYKQRDGTTLFRVDNSGNLLAGGIINTGSQTITSISGPQFRVQYDASNEVTFSVSDSGTTTIGLAGTTPSLAFTPATNRVNSFSFTNSAGTSLMSIDTTTGYVGVGTTNPSSAIHIATTSSAIARIESDTANTGTGESGLYLMRAGTTKWAWRMNQSGLGADYLSLWQQGGYNRLVVDTSGNVGIGTTTPSGLLAIEQGTETNSLWIGNQGSSTPSLIVQGVNGDGKVAIGSTISTGAMFQVGRSAAVTSNFPQMFLGGYDATNGGFPSLLFNNSGVNYLGIGSDNAGSMVLGVAADFNQNWGTKTMTLTQAGNVGIGTTTPTDKLTVQGGDITLNEDDGGQIAARISAGTESGSIALYNGDSTPTVSISGASGNNSYFNVFGGNLGIGSTTPMTKLTVLAGSGTISGTQDGLRMQVTSYNDAARNTIVWGQEQAGLTLGRFGLEWKQSTGQMNFVWRDMYNGGVASTELMRLTGGGSLGVGTTTPWAQFAVNPNGISGPAFAVGSSTKTDFVVTNGGKVGVGTTSPDVKVEISQSGAVDNRYIRLVDTGSSGHTFDIINRAVSQAGGFGVYSATAGEYRFVIDSSGRFGIAQNNPLSRLAVHGSAAFGATYSALAAPTNGMIVEGNVGIGTSTPWAQLSVNPNGVTGPAFAVGSSTKTDFVVTNGGYVGIGTTTPGGLLEVSYNGTLHNRYIRLTDTAASGVQWDLANRWGGTAGKFAIYNHTNDKVALSIDSAGDVSLPQSRLTLGATSGLFVINRGGTVSSADLYIGETADTGKMIFRGSGHTSFEGNVGIGTTAPNQLSASKALTIAATAASYDANIELWSNSDSIGDATNLGGVRWLAGTTPKSIATIQAVISGTSEDTAHLSFATLNGGTNTEKMRITNTGNVGVSTTTPWAMLSVNPNGITGPAFAIGSSTRTDFVVTNGGNVGIGTTTPTEKLHVNGFVRTEPVAWANFQTISTSANNPALHSSVVYNGKLYIGLAASNDQGTTGELYSYDGNSWAQITNISANSGVFGLGVFNGKLFAGTFNGTVLSYNGTSWTNTGVIGAPVRTFVSYNGKLYAGGGGSVYEWNGSSWSTSKTVSGADHTMALAVYNGKLYAGFSQDAGDGDIWVFDGSTWTISYDTAFHSVRTLAVYKDKLYAGFGILDGDVYSYDGTSWALAIDVGETIAGSLAVYDGKLYYSVRGSSNNNKLYSFDGANLVTVSTNVVEAPRSLAVYNGKLYGTDNTTTVKMLSGRLESQLAKEYDPEDSVSFNEQYQNFTKNLTILGSVGIGTTSPSKLLSLSSVSTSDILAQVTSTGGVARLRLQTGSVSGTQDGGGEIRFDDGNAVTRSYITSRRIGTTAGVNIQGDFAIDFETTQTDGTSVTGVPRMRITGSGNVGIGTTNPGHTLSVNGNVALKNEATFTYASTTSLGDYAPNTFQMTAPAFGAVSFGSNGAANRMILNTAGNVGIGTTTPRSLLAIYSGAPVLEFGDSTGAVTSRDWAIKASQSAEGDFGFYRSSAAGGSPTTASMYFDRDGNVGVGNVPATNAKLDVSGAIAIGGTRVFNTSGTQLIMGSIDASPAINSISLKTADIERLTINSVGNVGIGTTTPGGKLDIQDGNLYLSDIDVIHGDTTYAPSGSYGAFSPVSGTAGGLKVLGVSDTDANALYINGTIGAIDPTDTTAAVAFVGNKWNGASADQALSSLETVFQFRNHGTNLMTVLGSGNVGIGTTSPVGKLDVVGSGGTAILHNTNSSSYAGLRIYNDIGTAARGLQMNYSGSAYASALLTNGPVGESGMLATVGAYPLTFGTNNTAVMTLSSAGNVGIGTTSPLNTLGIGLTTGQSKYATFEVPNSGALAATYGGFGITETAGQLRAGIKVKSIGDGTYVDSSLSFLTTDGGVSGYEAMTIDKSGYVGIGTTTPGRRLQISETDAGTTANMRIAGGSSNIEFYKLNVANDRAWQVGMGTVSATAGEDFLFSSYNGSGWAERMRIQTNGNVGIGTTTPMSKFTVADSTTDPVNVAAIKIAANDSVGLTQGTLGLSTGIDFYTNSDTTSRSAIFSHFNRNDDNNSALSFWTSQHGGTFAERMRILGNGNVGIGTTSPGARLEVLGTTAGYPGVTRISDDGNYQPTIKQYKWTGSATNYSATRIVTSADGVSPFGGIMTLGVSTGYGTIGSESYTDAITIKSSGNVGIGTTTPQSLLEVYSTASSPLVARFTNDNADANGVRIALVKNTTSFAANDVIGRLEGITNATDNSQRIAAFMNFIAESNGSGFVNGAIAFNTLTSNTETERVRITNAGNVGIGTTTPLTKLGVIGSVGNAPTTGVTRTGIVGIGNATDNAILDIGIRAGGTGAWLQSTDKTDQSFQYPLLLNPVGGRVGIGTSTPQTTLSIIGASSAKGTLSIFSGTGSLTDSVFSVFGDASPAEDEKFRITRGGNVGIGTTTPLTKLHVAGSTPTLRIDSSNSSGTGALDFYDSVSGGVSGAVTATHNGGNDIVHIYAGATGSVDDIGLFAGDHSIRFTNNSAESMRILSSGNVGIGTTTPDSILTVAKNTNANIMIRDTQTNTLTDTGATLQLYGTRSTGAIGKYGEIRGWRTNSTADNAGYMAFAVSSADGTAVSEAIRIKEGGNVGIGTTTPLQRLTIAGSVDSDASGIQLTNTNSVADSKWWITSGVKTISNQSFGIKDVTSDAYRLVINSSGNVGIGTTTPDAKLQVYNGNVRVSSGYGLEANDVNGNIFLGGSTSGGGYAQIYTNSLERMRVTSAGNVGIGTTTPNVKTSVYGTSATTGDYGILGISVNGGGSGDSGLAVGYDTTNNWSWLYSRTVNVACRAINLNNTAYLGPCGGNVGIGTTSPYAKLSVVGEAVARNFTATSTTATSTFAGGFDVGNGAIRYDFSSGATSIENLELGNMSFESDAGIVTWTDMSVTAASAQGVKQSYTANINGNPLLTVYSESDGAGGTQNPGVGIGSTTPWGFLSINPNVIGGTRPLFSIGSTTNSQMVVLNTGFVGIGTTSPQRTLHVYRSTDGAPVRFEDSNGYCEIDPTTTTWTCTSDRTLKKDIENVAASTTLARMAQLQAVSFRWNKEEASSTPHYGFIAQEVEGVFPELVITAENGLKSVAYGGFTPFIIEAIKELKLSIEDIDVRVIDMEKRLAALEMFAEMNSGFASTSATTTASTTEATVASWLSSMGVAIGNAVSTFTSIVVDTFSANFAVINDLTVQNVNAASVAATELRVGTTTNAAAAGITILDRATGAPFCFFIINGTMQSQAGECSTPAPVVPAVVSSGGEAVSAPAPEPVSQEVIEGAASEGGSPAGDSATSSEPVLEGAPSTETVIEGAEAGGESQTPAEAPAEVPVEAPAEASVEPAPEPALETAPEPASEPAPEPAAAPAPENP